DSANWTRSDFKRDTLQTGDYTKIFAGSNIDRDSFGEVIVAIQGVKDSLYAGTDTAEVNPTSNRVILRVLEYSGKSTALSIKDMVLITPEDYKLSQNYPNPFNPTTTIEYTLPIASKISISIFNVMGQEVASIIQNQDKPAGTYQVTWNGMDKSGSQVASGTYFYSMRFGNFTKTKQMTFMK
ncbi:MAG: FlgD immunoglobulin-like domain containing protein, partial [Candidatus Marinimicrobia bacterium]|nr:FlgD immunoglobulin-like domain containing protein [Candidatus Neomarinimicrobiota bacterium]